MMSDRRTIQSHIYLLVQNYLGTFRTHELPCCFVHGLVHEVPVIQALAEDTLELLLLDRKDLAGIPHSVIALGTDLFVAHTTGGNSLQSVRGMSRHHR